ncbi:tyrosine-protein phosphatase non-receptor type 21-like isoform X1 [Mytilus californianus]|uniref:tyrosine-protein phosphatase non-receptor type 21-like isoform X1 n=1 Tax=Mytilus californianus TaxID=6549 RepID=UPI002247FCEA|nr:tyrosine-protein phosphatase non-receptor type 21-like isoform X1 [Mytilus californianus]
MPFGIKFKRTRRYEISSKNALVVGVHMLDNSYLECTLTSESTGQQCLDSIAQRIELEETQYFGLRYVTKKLQFHWIELDRPLKKQLDKHAQASNSPRLYFGVMFYIPGAHKLADEVARFQYFLQLKNDIVDGRIPLSVDQAVRLSALSLQAEFDDYQEDKNAQDYFKDNALFPKTMCKDETTVTEMMHEALNCYINLHGVHHVKAEINYIKDIQMMDGYGMDYYAAKDEKGRELYLGTFYQGMFARYLHGEATVFFRWNEIARLNQSKKTLEIDTSKSSSQYHMEDSDTAKYVRRFGLLQQKFYRMNKTTPSSSVVDLNEFPETGNMYISDLPPMDPLTQSQTSLTYSQLSYQSQDQRFDQELSQSTTTSAEDFFRQSQQSLETGSRRYNSAESQNSPTQPDPRQAMLPAYRPSPSYDQVMRHRVQQQKGNISNSQMYSAPQENITYSHPDIGSDVSNYSRQESDYVNSETIHNYNNNTLYANVFQEEKQNYMQYRERTSNLIIQPTYSSPELTGLPQEYPTENIFHDPLPFQYKPPPPYPRTSSSTPDLAVQTTRTNVSDSPDLISRKNMGLPPPDTESIEEVRVHDFPTENVEEINPSSEPITNPPPIIISHVETDDASSDYSETTFHLKDTDSELEDAHNKPPEDTPIQIKYVAPNKAPPPSTSKEVVVRRESFRRLMIANRSGQFNPNSLSSGDNPATGSSDKSVIPEVTTEKAAGLENPVEALVKSDSTQEPDQEVERDTDSDSDQEGTIKLKMGPLKMAAMNGLSMSRPMVLALMNDESRAPKDERRKILETKLSENLVFKEFEEIPKKNPNTDCSVSKLPENEQRNRFKDVLPYDASRVKLAPRKDNHSGYVNGSHIKLSVGDRVWWYIATQAPLQNTCIDFWQLIWEQEVDVIAMLTDLVEMGRQKCYPYWPQEVGPEHRITFGPFEVTLLFCNDSLCYITNRISVVHTNSKKERQIWHLQYTDWPDHGCPDDMYGFLGFLDEVDSVQRLAESEEGSGKKSPIVVHCSAGVGRTGVVILTQVMKWCLEHNHDIDLPKALAGIRNQRMFMVQTLGQYNFIHKTLIQYLKNTRLI